MILAITVLSTSGCTKYKSFSQLEGDVHFSFEYPENYYESTIDTLPGYSFVLLSRLAEGGKRTFVEDETRQDDSWITVSVYSHGSVTFASDAETLIEKDISLMSEDDKTFQIVERSLVIVSGVEAEYLEYQHEVIDYSMAKKK